MIAGLCNKEIIAPLVFEGNCDSNVFLSYVEQMLIKELKAGQIVIMDNIQQTSIRYGLFAKRSKQRQKNRETEKRLCVFRV